MEIKAKEKMLRRILVFAAILVLIVVNWHHVQTGLTFIRGVLSPVIVGCGIAYIVNLLVKLYERWLWPKAKQPYLNGLRRFASIFLGFLTIIMVFAFVFMLLVPQAINALATFAAAIPTLIGKSQGAIEQLLAKIPEGLAMIDKMGVNWSNIAAKATTYLSTWTQWVMSSLLSIVASSTSALFNLFLSLMVAIYVLAGKEKWGTQIRHFIKSYFKESTVNVIFNVLKLTDNAFSNFFSGVVIESIILGLMISLGMWALKLPYAAMLGALTGVMAFIPFVGAYIAAGVGALLLLAHSPMSMIIYLVFVVVIQQIESNLIYPFVVGNSIGLPGLYVLIAVTIGGGLAGIFGMIIGVPVGSAIYRIIQYDLRYRDEHPGPLRPLASLKDPNLFADLDEEQQKEKIKAIKA